MSLHTVVIGAGALGSIIAAHLARAGARVTLVARGARAEAIERDGLVLKGLATFEARVPVVRSATEAAPADLLVLATKTYDTTAALAGLGPQHVRLALSVQNGVQKNIDLARAFGQDRVLGAAAYVSGEVRTDGVTAFTVNDALLIGEPDGTHTQRAQAVVDLLAGSGLAARLAPSVTSAEWSKYAVYASLMAPAVLTRLETRRFASDPATAEIIAALVRDIGALAQCSGVTLDDDGFLPVASMCRGTSTEATAAVLAFGTRLAERSPAHRISALQDLERGRRLEVEETLGYGVRLATQLGIAVPTLETCYRLVAALDRQRG